MPGQRREPRDLRAQPGPLTTFHLPGGPGTRVDTHGYEDYVIPPYYDSLVAKLIVHDRSRDEAIARMRRALDFFVVEGIHTSIPLHKRILRDPDFLAGSLSTRFMERFLQRIETAAVCDGAMRCPAVYAIADAERWGRRVCPRRWPRWPDAGIGWIQVRGQAALGARAVPRARGCCRALEGSGAALWVDDRADLAALFPVRRRPPRADGPAPGRGAAGGRRGVRIGLSTHDEEQLAAADADPEVDVVAVGPVFPTSGKERPDPVVGLDFVRRARRV